MTELVTMQLTRKEEDQILRQRKTAEYNAAYDQGVMASWQIVRTLLGVATNEEVKQALSDASSTIFGIKKSRE